MSLANISTVLALTVACQASQCASEGEVSGKEKPCCGDLGEYLCVWDAAETCCYDRKDWCADWGAATYEGMPCCSGMTTDKCWFDAS